MRLKNRILKQKVKGSKVTRLAPEPDLPAEINDKLTEGDREALAKGGKR